MVRKMKSSGISWLGDIPNHWEVVNYRRVFDRRKEYDDNPNKQVLSLTITGVKEKNESFGKMAEDFTGHQIVRKGDLVFTPRDFDATPILSGIAPCDGCISNLYFVLRNKTDEICNQFYNYFMWGVKWGGDIWKKLSYGMRFSYNFNQFSDLPTVLIPLHEQQKIVKYLDRISDEIDLIIETERNEIELLKELRNSIIGDAVIKGINPLAPIKSTNIYWAKQIPKNWGIARLNSLFKERKCKNKGNEETNVLSLSYGNIKKRNLKDNMGLLPESFETYNIVEPGNIVLRLTDLQNDKKSLRSGIVLERGIITSAYVTLEKISNEIEPRYFQRLIHTFDIIQGFYNLGDGVRQNLKFQELGKLLFPIPSIEEQAQIADYIDEKMKDINSAISAKEEIITKLTEYKKSLIYEVVTGKKEVA